MQANESFDFGELAQGDEITVQVSATGGELQEDEEWTDRLRFVEKQSLKAQSRVESYKFERVEDGKKAYLRFSAEHKNNFGFTVSFRDQSEIDFDAMWQDPFTDDREWTVVGIEP